MIPFWVNGALIAPKVDDGWGPIAVGLGGWVCIPMKDFRRVRVMVVRAGWLELLSIESRSISGESST